ncbi:MAG TPA: sigma-70 family RNA polymerase sigma factor [Sorangium sp.]|nr:sigma-70 family RNA polymerase sigma factor [Sorangium sp.]
MAKRVSRSATGAIVSRVGTRSQSTARPSAVTAQDDQKAADRAAEKVLCERAKGGDKQALASLLRKHGPMLFRSVLLPRLGSEAAAQDALADTYMRVVQRFDQFEWRGCGIYPWLRVIAMRIALDMLRSRKRETLFDPADLTRAVEGAERDEQDGIDEQLCQHHDRDQARRRVNAALATINTRYAKAIRLRVLEERSREHCAEALGVTVGTFDVVLHRALKSMKKAVLAQREATS